MTIDTQAMLAEIDSLTGKLQAAADELQRALECGELESTREAWTARELLHHGAAYARGAAVQIDKHQQSVTPVTRSMLDEQEETE